MPLNSVQTYTKNLLDGYQLPLTQQGAVAAFIAPPDPQTITQPLVYIWGSTIEERRATMSKPLGNKELVYNIDLWIYWVGDADDPMADSMFPVVIDGIHAALRSVAATQVISDPITGVNSTLINFGEDLKTDYAPARTLEDEASVLYMARVILHVKEWMQG